MLTAIRSLLRLANAHHVRFTRARSDELRFRKKFFRARVRREHPLARHRPGRHLWRSSSSRSRGRFDRSPPAADEAAIRGVLDEQVAAWNRATSTASWTATGGREAHVHLRRQGHARVGRDARSLPEEVLRSGRDRRPRIAASSRSKSCRSRVFSPNAALVRGRYILEARRRDGDRSVHARVSQVSRRLEDHVRPHVVRGKAAEKK